MEDKLFKRVLVAVDGSENSKRALNIAIEIAKAFSSELFVINVVPPPVYYGDTMGSPVPLPAIQEYYNYAQNASKKLVEDSVEECRKKGVDAKGFSVDGVSSVVDAIVQFAEKEKVELIVVGTRGLSGLKKLILGSVSSGVVSQAPCSVLVVK
ncbi:hypothetical protein B9Q11_01335 [Candidatus Marsarchaeota G2 archaeon ECH_B_SAG-F08]|jgi:Universal stress protein UspA and related nucleotide-binding proteins|uniref:UspA domain-containing protein n=6 Tax=Candidatus Marsarchaeota TaxID=1978152 RepID=A0A2R6ADI1_9ARCH|nr:MAG: hypothetical protein B9Q01_04570 [Candidatus Marsarchaeota G1 archaeon OSP_D]PSN84399.1 MAG: hypothetical protein B9Q02_09520 [Candidatus Marsarchaeota G1 archaeon BE_D]PSN88982.1 MAG: hypothetical protein B9Q00_03205 [Candidatus Marsarchaeota G1 archaeon OSP_C]PSN99082.1 MAG: hypothetical protein B9Q11_01335 [Candidatus Marsarchaeota G2 archaeon ECH_B_SAG-F08]PSO02376.1 MAG: hypothetical protein B9Q10_01405 [Candidatus Marsarchaeota G2 archaeon ECH_B_SAG-E12]PSO05921.1 MAG: hypothetic